MYFEMLKAKRNIVRNHIKAICMAVKTTVFSRNILLRTYRPAADSVLSGKQK